MSDDKIVDLAFSEGQKNIEYQVKVHDSFLTRAQGVIALNAFFSGIVGKDALSSRPPEDQAYFGFSVWEILAISCLVISLILALWVLRPAKGWIFTTSPAVIIDDYYATDKSAEETKIILARYSLDNFQSNDLKLATLSKVLQGAFALSLAQVVLWLIDLRIY